MLYFQDFFSGFCYKLSVGCGSVTAHADVSRHCTTDPPLAIARSAWEKVWISLGWRERSCTRKWILSIGKTPSWRCCLGRRWQTQKWTASATSQWCIDKNERQQRLGGIDGMTPPAASFDLSSQRDWLEVVILGGTENGRTSICLPVQHFEEH